MSCTYYIYIYIAYIFRSWEVWSCSCRRRTDLHVLQILNIYIYICIAYIFRWCFWSCFCRRRTYLHVLHILYIYTLLVYSGEASGPATVGAGLIYMSCTYYIYIYIHCLYIQVMLLVMLLLAQDLFTCLAHIIYVHCLYIQVMLLVMLLSAQDLFTCLAHIIYIYIYILLVYSGDAFGSASVGAGLIYMSCKSTTFISMIQIHQDQNIHQSASWGIWNASIFQARSYVSQNMSFVWDVYLQNDTYHHMMYSFPILGNFFLAPACILCFAKQLDHGKLVQVLLEHRCYGWVIHLTLRDQLIGDRKSLKAIQ